MEGRYVLVTAASKGLGKAVAEGFAAEGANVMIASRNADQLAEAAEQIRASARGKVYTRVADVSNKTDVEALFKEVSERFGVLDTLVTNAGGPPGGTFESTTEEAWENAFYANFMSVVRLTKQALPLFRARGGGRVVHIASSSIKQPIEGLVLSNAFRTGIMGLSKTMAIELARDNILVNTVGPGRIGTDRTLHLDEMKATAAGVPLESIQAKSRENIPLGRYGTPQEFAKHIVFLGSSANTYVTGQALLVDGGMIRAF